MGSEKTISLFDYSWFEGTLSGLLVEMSDDSSPLRRSSTISHLPDSGSANAVRNAAMSKHQTTSAVDAKAKALAATPDPGPPREAFKRFKEFLEQGDSFQKRIAEINTERVQTS